MDVTDSESVEAAVKAGEELQIDTCLELQSGIVLRLKPVSSGLLRKAAARIPEPEVPRVWLAEKDREEENPNDPNYLAALVARGEKQGLAQMDVAILYGTSIETIPEGAYRPDDEEWSADLLEDGFLTDEDLSSYRKRYLNWVLLYACRGGDEAKLFGHVIILCGLTEAEVQEVLASFRSRSLRGADTERPAEESD